MTKLPEPKGWKILIKKPKPKEKTSGGILLPDSSRDAESLLGICAQVVTIGPMCWHDRASGEPWVGGPWAKPGDWVIVPKFVQFRMNIDDEEYRFINDDEIIAVVDDPKAIKVYT
jgi:co-chaperonin GroES (HSP10)